MEQREIKFRAWSEDYGIMVTEPQFINLIGDGKYAVFVGNEKQEEWINFNCCIMQYTGKKDRNDKDIYEGDIVSVYGEFRLVEFKHSFWHLELKEGNVLGGFGTETQAGHKPIYRYTKDWIEVVGNIYENPEMITSLV